MDADRPPLEPGLSGSVDAVVTEEATARAVGSGDVPVFATPMVLALVERAAVAALAGRLAAGLTSVGTSVELSHLAPTPVGGRVRATALLDGVEGGRRLSFSFTVGDEAGEIASGRHRRVVVERERFVRTANRRAAG